MNRTMKDNAENDISVLLVSHTY